MKNRMRETCTSGSVGGEGGNILTYPAKPGADYLLAVKSHQPTLRAEIESLFTDAGPADLDSATDHDKGHGCIEQRTVTVARQVDWLDGDRRFPGEARLPNVATVVKVASRAELKDRCRFETRYYVSSAVLCATRAAEAVRAHWAIENSLHWVLDVTFGDDLTDGRALSARRVGAWASV